MAQFDNLLYEPRPPIRENPLFNSKSTITMNKIVRNDVVEVF